uniref:Uncharacterized protein n=1 Tax=viral metagenome TaxID=1070528 RepID=A0A6C0DI54_9ZZZZ
MSDNLTFLKNGKIDQTLPDNWEDKIIDPIDPGVLKELEDNNKRIRKEKTDKIVYFLIALLVLTSIFTLVDYLMPYTNFSPHSNYLLGILISSAIVTVLYTVISMITEINYDPNISVSAGLVVGVIYCLVLVWMNYAIYEST